MKIAIFANTLNSFVLPMAQGLKRMLDRINIKSTMFYYGMPILNQSTSAQEFMGKYKPNFIKNIIKKIILYPYLLQLKSFDVIIVIQSKPDVFLKSFKVDAIRSLFPDKVIVLYDVDYLPRYIDMWKMFRFKRSLHHGLEMYDWYLCASDVWEMPMPPGHQPYSRIGIDIDDGTLFPEQKDEFIAVIDFEHEQTMKERAVQIEALEKTNTKFIVLSGDGNFSIREIRAIYRKCSLFFVAWQEAYGLPICELQCCGSYIFTPYANWCYAHSLKKDLYVSGLGDFSPNIIVYDNNLNKLISEIERIKNCYDPGIVVDNYEKYHPHFFHGDMDALQQFIEMIKRNEITSKSHNDYFDLKI